MFIQRRESNYVTHLNIQIHVCDVRLRYRTLQQNTDPKNNSLTSYIHKNASLYMQESYEGMPRSTNFPCIVHIISLATLLHGANNNCNVAFLQTMGAGLPTQSSDDNLRYDFMDEWLKSCALSHVNTTCFHWAGAGLHRDRM